MAKRAASKKKALKIKLTRVQELAGLYRIMEIAHSGHIYSGTLEMMAIDISMTTQFPFVAIEHYDAPSQTLQITAARGFDPSPELISAERSLAGSVAVTGRPLIHHQASDEFWKSKQINTYCGFPLIAGKKCIGALSFGHPEQVEMDLNLQKWAAGVAAFIASFAQWNLMSEEVVREKKQTEAAEAAPRAGQDELTQLPNAELFRFLLSQALARARRDKDLITVLFLDLDRFKAFRSASGEETADNVMRQMADRLRRNVREGDTVARWADDQFIWLISSLQNMDGVAMIAEKMLAIIKRPVPVEDKVYNLTTSIGISLYPYDGADTETLIKRAQTALIHAKELGRDTYHFYSDEVNSKVLEQLNFKRQLREGLDRHEFVLHYQPIVDIQTRRISGVEAFIRWQNPDGKLTYPGEFLLLSEDTGLIALLDQWVIKTACEHVRKWESKTSGPLQISVNISNRLFQQEDFVERVAEIVSQSQIRPGRLELELTEQTIMVDPERSAQILTRLKEIGVVAAIDNFGTSGFSLSHFKQFPVRTLKIDPKFLRDTENNPGKPSLVSAIISMAHALNLKVVAEGVERDAELNLLRSFQCDCYQGNLFSLPIPEQAFEELLRKQAPKAPAAKAKAVEEHLPWPVSAAAPEITASPTTGAPVRKQVDEEHLPWPVSASAVLAETEPHHTQPVHVPQPKPTSSVPSALLMVPRNLDRLPDAKMYVVTCYNCRNKHDAMETTWCSCLTSERTFVCPSCLKCFCRATLEYKIDFWAEAPRNLWSRRVKEETEHSVVKPNLAPEKVKRPLILVVDDEVTILAMAAHALEGLGLGVIVGANGEEALQLARRYTPNVILSDALMPKMDGREMCRLLKQDSELSNIKVIIMSSMYYSGKQRSGAFREFKIDEYLQKPVDFYILKSLLDKFLS